VLEGILTLNALEGWLIDVLAFAIQPCASVTVTEYVPAPRFVAADDVCPFDHTKVYGSDPPEEFAVALPLLPE